MARWLAVAALVVLLDQLSKWWITQHLLVFEVRHLLPVFDLTLIYNEGAAFSLLSEAGGWQRWFFIALALLILGVLWVWLRRLRAGPVSEALGIALVMGGALGNLIDRIRIGHVIDFLDFHLGGWHWPAFNIADAAISLGVVLLIVATVRSGGRRES